MREPIDISHSTTPEHARWRRLQAMVHARVFGDELPMVGRYRLQRALGSGVSGVVFRALDTELDREVALKLLAGRADAELRRRLQREAKGIARVVHPNVVGIYDVGEHEGQLFVAMELVVGRTLREWIDERPRAWRETARVFAAAARGLAAAHAAGLVHRDFKPDNVLIEAGGRVCVVDFGLVTRGAVASEPLARTVVAGVEDLRASIPLAGTPAYMAPEQITGRPLDARADVWSLCVALFEALYGARPFDRGTIAETLAAASRGEIAWPRSQRRVPRRLDRVLRRGLRPDRDDRSLDCAAIAVELDAAVDARRRRGIATAAVVFTGALVWVTARAFTGTPRTCDVDPTLERSWTPEVHARVVERLDAHGIADAAAVVATLDGYAQRWREQLAAQCIGPEDTTKLAAQLCLQRQREAFTTTVGLLAGEDAVITRDHAQLVAALGDPASCTEVRAGADASLDDGASERFAEQRLELVRARALWNAGDDDGASALARTGLDLARTEQAWWLVADAGILLSEIAWLRGDDLAASMPTLLEAREAAERVGWQSAIARADVLLIQDPARPQASEIQRRFSVARAGVQSTRDVEAIVLLAIVVEQLGSPVLAIDDATATSLRRDAELLARARLGEGHRLVLELEQPPRSDPPQMVAARAMLAQDIARWGPKSFQAAYSRLVLAVVLRAEGRLDEAIVEHVAALARTCSVTGETSSMCVPGVAALFELQAQAGRTDDASVTATRAIAALDQRPRHPLLESWSAESVADDAARALLRNGEVAGGLVFARRAVEEPDRFRRVPHELTLVEGLVRTGELADAERVVARIWALMHEDELRIAPVSTYRALVRLARAELRLRSGREDGVADDIRAALPDLLSTRPREQVRAHLGLAMVAVRGGDTEAARRELELAERFSETLTAIDPLRSDLAALRSELE
ncbi:MAG: protein kinase [Deltaproteobacteria bacterium]|nr:protein kinase [Nannocystaceae bacterium]